MITKDIHELVFTGKLCSVILVGWLSNIYDGIVMYSYQTGIEYCQE